MRLIFPLLAAALASASSALQDQGQGNAANAPANSLTLGKRFSDQAPNLSFDELYKYQINFLDKFLSPNNAVQVCGLSS